MLDVEDLEDRPLPKRSVVKVGKLFTMHRHLIAARFGAIKEEKLREVLGRLRALFAGDDEAVGAAPEAAHDQDEFRAEEVDKAVLALLHLNAFEDHGVVRAWKTFDWDAMDRLHEKGLITHPKSKAKSVVPTEEGKRAAEEAFWRCLAADR